MPIRKNTTYSSRSTHASRAAHARGDRQFRTYDTSYIEPRKSKAPIIVGIIVAIVVVVGAIFGISTALNSCSSNNLVANGTNVEFTVSNGEGGGAVADNLVKAGLISSASDFKSKLSSMGAEQSLKPGTYTIVGGSSAEQIINQLIAGPVVNGISFVVPEGYTVSSIAGALAYASNGRISMDAFMEAAANVDAYRSSYSFIGTATSLEGFLFPKTYALTDDDTADSMIRKMLDQYSLETGVVDFSFPESKGLTKYQALILASIVEKESDESVRAKVAAVFYNRLLTTGDPSYGYLQSDATTAYEVGHDPTAEEVHADTPYSTYTHVGLPPTPICNPGIEAIKAVCSPDMDTLNNGYYFFYFAKDENGQMQYYFSKTLEEHNAVIAEHQA